ncbi:protein-disulfide reductase DsbD family protein [Candidatus Mesenet endosymbiont of Phosphuga atrata]|uniref:protein-disulfide reductase DsbD family protein n=1 Tax=Candidatus Mesenet endosymbiont of Phosphuga atrata TaxID=3066221 RepID=UPI0030D3D428
MSFINAIISAFIGGIILNCMPCVFPVLSLKFLSILKKAKGLSNLTIKIEGLAYTVGVLLCMFILAVLLLILRSMGGAVGWGYQMQSPIFILVLLYLMFLIGLSFSGFYDISFILPNFGNKYINQSNCIGSFCTGVFAILVATPCSAPFMASAVGFALTQPTLHFLLIFQALGFGVAFPYLLISFFPTILKFLPKPGQWMETVKQFLAFPMYLSSIWLFWVLIKESNANTILPALTGLLLLVFSIWVLTKLSSRIYTVVLLIFLNLLPFAVVKNMVYVQDTNVADFSIDKLISLVQNERNVLVAVGADWCVTCKINEHLLTSKDMQTLLRSKNVMYMKADWTKKDEKITEYLLKFKRGGVPLYVLYFHNKEGKILPQILSKEVLVSELQ